MADDAVKNMLVDYGVDLRKAARFLSQCTCMQRDQALMSAAQCIKERRTAILDANAADLKAAQKKGLSDALLDRLKIDEDRLNAMLDGIHTVARLPDPVGLELEHRTRPNGLSITKVSVPLGVIGVIYESRPNVTVDAAALALKSGNALLLRGGSEAVETNRALQKAFVEGLVGVGVPSGCVRMVPTQDRRVVGQMLSDPELLDVVVPRGGKSLVERVQREARVPVFAHLDGICHLYLHPKADRDQARAVILNAKMRRPGICGALETLLIDARALDSVGAIVTDLLAAGCELRGDRTICAADDRVKPAKERDWSTEYLDAILSIRTVDGVDGAAEHIRRYGSGHTDGILTEDLDAAKRFMRQVDSAIVMHNASTQFADGGEFGMGAEIGIATGRFHARGPVGVRELTTYKYEVRGTGQTRP